MNALNVLCAQLTRDLFAIAKFLCDSVVRSDIAEQLYACVFNSYNKRSKFYIDDQAHPQTIDVMKTRAV